MWSRALTPSHEQSAIGLAVRAHGHLVTGVDLVEIERIVFAQKRYGERFLARIFTPDERESTGERPASLAARFAVKEATAKALGTGIGAISWQMIAVRSLPGGQPVIQLSAAAAERATVLGISEWHVSLSHSRTLAVAFVVGYRNAIREPDSESR